MKKLLGLGFAAAMFAGQANAGFINVVTGADMAGLVVKTTYSDLSSETLIWDVISPRPPLTDTVSLESALGGVSSLGFSLSQRGDSQGNIDDRGTVGWSDDIFYGLWTLVNRSNLAITQVMISALNTNIVFDTDFNDNGNGSDRGRAFVATSSGATATYSSTYSDELMKVMTINLSLQAGGSIQFMADTDSVAVPAPATLSLLGLALLGLAAGTRRKKA